MAPRKMNESIDVEIFGSTYSLRGGEDPGAVRDLAKELDARMRTLAAPGSGADPLKVAILAALRLADEARETRTGASRREETLRAKLDSLAGRLDRALETGGPGENGVGRA